MAPSDSEMSWNETGDFAVEVVGLTCKIDSELELRRQSSCDLGRMEI